jgi:hypothetical protein
MEGESVGLNEWFTRFVHPRRGRILFDQTPATVSQVVYAGVLLFRREHLYYSAFLENAKRFVALLF